MTESDVGTHKISVSLLLYQSLFLSTVLFNSQTWSKLRKKDIEELKNIQLRFLKKIMGVAKSTCNAFIYLELGVLPIDYEIHKRQLMFLYRILNLDEDDPVYRMYENMIQFSLNGESNWWTDVKQILAKYIGKETEDVKKMTKTAYRALVNSSIERAAFEDLKTECQSKKKTSTLSYDTFKTQNYLKELYPNQSKTIFKCRSQTLDLKSQSTYKYTDLVCRRCGLEDETVEHVINCGHPEKLFMNFDDETCIEDTANTIRCIRRIEDLIDEVTP